MRQVAKGGLAFLDKPDNRKISDVKVDHDQGQYPSKVRDMYMIYKIHSSRNQQKRALQEIYVTENAMTPDLRWSDILPSYNQVTENVSFDDRLPMLSTKESSTSVVLPAYLNVASPKRKGNSSYRRYTLAPVGITQLLGPW